MEFIRWGEIKIEQSQGRTIKPPKWNLNDGSCIATLTGHADPVGCVALAGNKALTSDCFTIKIWNIDDSKCVRTLKPCGGPWALALSRKYVAAGFSQGQVQVWSER